MAISNFSSSIWKSILSFPMKNNFYAIFSSHRGILTIPQQSMTVKNNLRRLCKKNQGIFCVYNAP